MNRYIADIMPFRVRHTVDEKAIQRLSIAWLGNAG